MIRMEQNVGGKNVVVDFSVESDDGIFLAMLVQDDETGHDIVDLVTSEPREIEEFFSMVEQAKKQYETLSAS